MRIVFLIVLVCIAGCAEYDWTVLEPSGENDGKDTVTHERATMQEAVAASEASRERDGEDTARPFHQEMEVPDPLQQHEEDWTVLEPTGPGGQDPSVVHERSTLEEAEAEAELSRERDEGEIPTEIPEVPE